MNVPETAVRAVVDSPSTEAQALDHVISCNDCGEIFTDHDTFDAHQRTDEQRNPPSIRFLKGAPLLPRCIQPSTLWAMGWTRARSSSKSPAVRKLAAIWHKPVAPPLRPHKKRSGDEWVCLVCKKAFASATGWLASIISSAGDFHSCRFGAFIIGPPSRSLTPRASEAVIPRLAERFTFG